MPILLGFLCIANCGYPPEAVVTDLGFGVVYWGDRDLSPEEIDLGWRMLEPSISPRDTVINLHAPNIDVAFEGRTEETGHYWWNIGTDSIELEHRPRCCVKYPALVHEMGHLWLAQNRLNLDPGHTSDFWEVVLEQETLWKKTLCERRTYDSAEES